MQEQKIVKLTDEELNSAVRAWIIDNSNLEPTESQAGEVKLELVENPGSSELKIEASFVVEM